MHNVMTDEIWKDIEGYEGVYMVSNTGFVRNIRRGKVLADRLNTKGYKQVVLSAANIPDDRKTHRLVAEAYIPNPLKLPEVNHKDKDKLNNHVSNLEWCDSQHNNEHDKAKRCMFISPHGKLIEVFNISKFCRDNKLNQSCMNAVSLGRSAHHKGWRKHVQ